jgi:hypothetical protein
VPRLARSRVPRSPHGFSLALIAFALSCAKGDACPDDPSCPKGSSCRCEDGRLFLVEQQRDGTTVRQITYRYDDEGRRLGQEGWQLRCDGSKFTWTCSHEVPCAAPYDACTSCRKEYSAENSETGALEPCGPNKGPSKKR